uniref:SKA complex subunit 1 n=1 Tax=Heligmosomoides polygyrus TaxID=6339 RepID=A0A183GAF6_HELPZ
LNCPVAKPTECMPVESSECSKAPSNAEIAGDAPSNAIIPSVTSEEFETIPKYMRGRMTISELNEIVSKFDEFLSFKRRMLNANFKKLTMKDKDQVSKWREEEPAAIAGQLFCQEADVKPQLKDRTRLLLRTALPCLRHVRRIKEVQRMSGEKYEIKRILKARKMEGKNKMEYLVDWQPTWVYEQDMEAALLDDYHMTIEVLGPLHSPENLKKTSIKDMDMVLKRQSKREQPSSNEVILELMSYEEVKKLYPEELFAYMEGTFSLPDEMCTEYEKDDAGKKVSRKKRKSTK